MNEELLKNAKEIPGYEGRYVATSDGKIFNIKTKHELKPNMTNTGGYCRVRISSGCKGLVYVHILVAKTFLQNPDNKPQVNHKNGNKLDNRVINLEWCTCAENMLHAFEHGLYPHRKVHPSEKAKIVELVEQGVSKREVAARYGLKLRGLESLLWRNRRANRLSEAA